MRDLARSTIEAVSVGLARRALGAQTAMTTQLPTRSVPHSNTPSPLTRLLMVIGCVLYAVMPLDLIPDVLVCVGWLDDLIVIGLTLRALYSGADR